MRCTGMTGASLLLIAASLWTAAIVSAESPRQVPPPKFKSLQLTKTGGFAGVHDVTTLDGQGGWQFSSRARTDPTKGKLSAAQLETLNAAVAAVDWSKLKARYDSSGRGADMFNYEIILTDAEGKTFRSSIRDFETNSLAPKELRALISLIESMVKK
ncbi:MAG: hypothetical protein LLG01_18745 [Planctomycetaceae bacterium]|nr:hypothetical protein [Planctomycetaceae bacterium]